MKPFSRFTKRHEAYIRFDEAEGLYYFEKYGTPVGGKVTDLTSWGANLEQLLANLSCMNFNNSGELLGMYPAPLNLQKWLKMAWHAPNLHTRLPKRLPKRSIWDVV